MLTDKAKQEFWCSLSIKELKEFDTYSVVIQNALIIDWFDSVGIIITIDIYRLTQTDYGFTSTIWSKGFRNFEDIDNFKSRQEATKKAIEKANEIFNNLECNHSTDKIKTSMSKGYNICNCGKMIKK